MPASNLIRLRRELTAAERIPYTAHVDRTVLRTRSGHYVQSFRLGGASFECADDAEINNWHERLNVLWRNIASPNVALWTHLLRRRDHSYPDGQFRPGFANDLNNRYRRLLAGETLMVNELYLSLVYRPAPSAAQAWTLKALMRSDPRTEQLELAASLESCAKLSQLVAAALTRYGPELLGIYGDSPNGRVGSSLLEFLGALINSEQLPISVPRAPLNETLATSRLLFGTEVLEFRTATHSRLGAMLGIKEYASPTKPGLLNRLLAVPFPLVLSQSFTFLSKGAGQSLLQRQYHRLTNAGDFSRSQAEELHLALDALTSNSFVMGDHHLTLQIQSDLIDHTEASQLTAQLKLLNERTAIARSALADTGLAVAREDLALEAAFWAQLPGNFAYRPRKAPISSRNFAAYAPFHNYPAGRAHGNHWGEALTTLVTSAQSPYWFSLHATDEQDSTGNARRDIGHTFLCGPTGSGKTVLIGFLMAMLQKQEATQIVFDKDRGLELLVRALGGTYLPLGNGVPTGLNPLRLQPTPGNMEFLKSWLRQLAKRSGTLGAQGLSARESADLDHALHGTLTLEPNERRLSRLIEFLDATDPEGPFARLAPWCADAGGDYAWVFDNEQDVVAPLLGQAPVAGFDVTDFLDHSMIRTPVTMYLFHLVRQMLDGRRLVCWLDEFWRLVSDPAFESFAKDGPKTWRKLNAVMCLATQSPSDVLASPLSRTIIEQTATKVFFPNAAASAEEYQQGFGLSERECRLIREQMESGARQFLVRQGTHSVVCELNLRGFADELAVISGRSDTVRLANSIIAKTGAGPRDWLPEFYRARTSLIPPTTPSSP